jgi:hypothetical protein
VPLLPAPEAEPGPPELGTAPDVPVLLLPGVDVVPPALEPVLPALEPLPVVMPSSFKHFSRSVPTMPRHLLLVLPEAPLELLPVALGELLLGELLLGELLLGELLLGVLLLGVLLLGVLLLGVLLPVAPVELLPDAPEELPEVPEALSDEPLPVAPALLPVLPPPMLPDGEAGLCANDTLDSAKSAAAVAALMSFNVMSFSFLTCWVRGWRRWVRGWRRWVRGWRRCCPRRSSAAWPRCRCPTLRRSACWGCCRCCRWLRRRRPRPNRTS